MIHLNPESVEAVRTATVQWAALLARSPRDAVAMIDEPNSYGVVWSAERIRSAIDETFGHTAEPLVITDPDPSEALARVDVVELSDGSGYSVYVPLPLGGAWSDLTIQLEFLRRRDGLALVLHDLHVM